MIDLHVHILPGLDDGASSVSEALEMARIAVAGGIKAAVATPHVITGLYNSNKEEILASLENLNKLIDESKIPLKVLPGAEYRLEPDLPVRLARGELLTLGDSGRYLLVELPADFIPQYTGRVIFELLIQGVVPVVAHPERNAGFIKDPSLLYELIARGALTQVTAGSINGRFGSGAAAAARLFLEHGCAHFIASDAHSPRGRAPVLTEAMEEATRILGMDRAGWLVRDNPRRVVHGEGITATGLKKIRPARRGFFRRLFFR